MVPTKENKAELEAIGNNWPSHCAKPRGAKLQAIIKI